MKTEHAARMLPADHDQALLVGRMQLADGPTPVVVKQGKVIDVSAHAATVADLLERSDVASLDGPVVCDTAALADPAGEHPPILSPIDLQCVKAAGVTFAVSALERVIEERARGDADAAQGIRGELEARIGGGIRSVKPGSAEAAELKAALIEAGMWSQYLEVAIGPDAEVFTKAPVLSTIGWGGDVGIRSDSSWNNPEPEIVIVATSDGKSVGATLGNDVNLRDFEGRSALLLGKAKDNNASTGIGPFIRLFDGDFTMDTVRDAVVDLRIDGPEGYVLTGTSTMREISRDPEDLVRQALSEHQYPDGFVLFLGTLFAPVQDRDEPGRGFTHKPGDVVRISTPSLGELVNTVTTSKVAAPWGFGIRDLMRNLARRGLIAA
ncbi:fumarylacetoacetate hydrolase [Sphingomonas sp. Leaf407]|uniref:fumarylacetoacetate hydrolase family protein n=1 Tax=unclassified Sphingomonas TaxID=196159 RepID=UPI0006FF4394|nr:MULTISPECIES: fumarylacetoacetate hydrolase family protein [unclassified Sphingomonas]KQN37067.1 fumarylacetoacetate hydrolase [Sphingomonas sp. Leaf42]KQT30494.1 fumarylacetoacetate hydrolase [Sphingomonas sp. Leaf407]